VAQATAGSQLDLRRNGAQSHEQSISLPSREHVGNNASTENAQKSPPTSACKTASDPFKEEVDEKLLCLLCVLHSVAAEIKISDHLHTNLCLALAVLKCHRVAFQWMCNVTNNAPLSTPSGFNHLRVAKQCLGSITRTVVSRHLDPFLHPSPEGSMSWENFVRVQLLEEGRDRLFTWWQNSVFWADRCYSLLFFYLHLTTAQMVTWPDCESYLSLCDKTIAMYEACSSDRHHRLPILRLLRKYLKPFPLAPDHKKAPCTLGMTKGKVMEPGTLEGERLLAHFLAREPVLGPRIMDFGKAATRFHTTF